MNRDKIKNLKRIMNNFTKSPSYNTILDKEETEYLIDHYSNLIFCNGKLRKIIFKPIIDSRYQVLSEGV